MVVDVRRKHRDIRTILLHNAIFLRRWLHKSRYTSQRIILLEEPDRGRIVDT